MSDTDSPVARLVPYLLAITVTVFATLAVVGQGGNLLLTLVIAVVAYFGTYFLSQFVIRLFTRRGRGDDPH